MTTANAYLRLAETDQSLIRTHMLARLAAERSNLLELLLGLADEVLTGKTVQGDWTTKDILAHLAGWDRWHARAMETMAAGADPDMSGFEDEDLANAAQVAVWRDQPLDDIVAEVEAARADWLHLLMAMSEDVFLQPRPFRDQDWSFPLHLRGIWEHDAEHAEQLLVWRVESVPKETFGPKSLLLAALAAAREELLAGAALVAPVDRSKLAMCGVWTLKDLLAHIADWEWVGLEGLRRMAAGEPPGVEFIDDMEAWNQEHARERRDQPWDQIWDDLQTTRQAFLAVLEGMSQSTLEAIHPFPWGPYGTAYQWTAVFIRHDREHAEDLRPEEMDWSPDSDATQA